MSFLSEMSAREKNLWAELLVDTVVALYYFPNVFSLIAAGKNVLVGFAMAILVVKTIFLAIVISTAAAIILRVWQEPGKEDERDYQFSARGTMIANRALIIFTILIIGQIMMEALLPGRDLQRRIIAAPLIIAHLLLLSLMLSSTIKSVAQLFFYRRGY